VPDLRDVGYLDSEGPEMFAVLVVESLVRD
jgi:hypothetical protein